MPEPNNITSAVVELTSAIRDAVVLSCFERAVINAAVEWWNHSLAEPQRLILLRTIDALISARENQ